MPDLSLAIFDQVKLANRKLDIIQQQIKSVENDVAKIERSVRDVERQTQAMADGIKRLDDQMSKLEDELKRGRLEQEKQTKILERTEIEARKQTKLQEGIAKNQEIQTLYASKKQAHDEAQRLLKDAVFQLQKELKSSPFKSHVVGYIFFFLLKQRVTELGLSTTAIDEIPDKQFVQQVMNDLETQFQNLKTSLSDQEKKDVLDFLLLPQEFRSDSEILSNQLENQDRLKSHEKSLSAELNDLRNRPSSPPESTNNAFKWLITGIGAICIVAAVLAFLRPNPHNAFKSIAIFSGIIEVLLIIAYLIWRDYFNTVRRITKRESELKKTQERISQLNPIVITIQGKVNTEKSRLENLVEEHPEIKKIVSELPRQVIKDQIFA
jgi:hypothetical protein